MFYFLLLLISFQQSVIILMTSSLPYHYKKDSRVLKIMKKVSENNVNKSFPELSIYA